MNTGTPCNPNASREAKSLLAYLYSIRGQKTLIAAHDYITTGTRCYQLAEKLSGKSPAIWGSDFSFLARWSDPAQNQTCGPMNVTPNGEPAAFVADCDPHAMRMNLIRNAIRQHENGCRITLMWHSAFPTYGDEDPGDTIWTLDRRPSHEVWRELTTEGTLLHQQWLTQVDRIASYLQILRDRKIPVLWRPYHEMNGVWFWWCNKPGKDGFERLWRQMYRRLVDDHHLDNLLWVWNAHSVRHTPGDEAYDCKDFYPGHDCVDVLATDIYNKPSAYLQLHHDSLLQVADGKPIAIGECGGVPDPDIFVTQTEWAWFMPWGNALAWGVNHNRVPALYSHPRCVGREALSCL